MHLDRGDLSSGRQERRFSDRIMLIFLPLLISILIPGLLVGLHFLRPSYTRHWWIAAFGTVTVFLLTGLLRLLPDQDFLLTTWIPQANVPAQLTLRLDPISWAFAISLATLGLAGILTDVTRLSQANWSTWSSSIGLIGMGILAVFSGNPLTLLLTWQAIDLVEVIILLNQGYASQDREPIVVIFSIRLLGSVLITAAILAAASQGIALSFDNLSQSTATLLLLGAFFRFGALPFYTPILQRMPLSRELGTILRLVPAAASLILVNRVAVIGVTSPAGLVFIILAGVIGVYSAVAWSISREEIAGRRFWMLGMISLALASAVVAQPQASLAWSLALILPGGMLFLASVRERLARSLLIAGLVCFSALPFTPAWSGLGLYAPPTTVWMVFFILIQAFLLAGYARHSLRPTGAQAQLERSGRVIYLIGLALLLTVNILISILNATLWKAIPPAQNWPLLAILALSVLAYFLMRRGNRLPPSIEKTISQVFSLAWITAASRWLYRVIRQGIAFVSMILEGEGGILWSFLILALLLSVFFGVSSMGAGR